MGLIADLDSKMGKYITNISKNRNLYIQYLTKMIQVKWNKFILSCPT